MSFSVAASLQSWTRITCRATVKPGRPRTPRKHNGGDHHAGPRDRKLPGTLTVEAGAGVSETLGLVLVVFGVAVVLVLPALGLLYTLSQRGMLETEGGAGGATTDVVEGR